MNKCEFSRDGIYRYVLHHSRGDLFDPRPKRIAWIGLNPSTADEYTLDQTLKAVRRYSEKWGFSEIVMLNLFAYRATDPREMKRALDPIGPDNDAWLVAETKAAHQVVACWGTHGAFLGRDEHLCALLRANGIALTCLSKTKDGSPHHPLYLKPDIILAPFS